MLQVFLCENLFGTPFEGRVFAGKLDEVMRASGEILDEDTTESDCTKESANFRQVVTWAPIAYDGEFVDLGESAFISAAIAKHDVVGCDQNGLLA